MYGLDASSLAISKEQNMKAKSKTSGKTSGVKIRSSEGSAQATRLKILADASQVFASTG
jgi:hypothetical protein